VVDSFVQGQYVPLSEVEIEPTTTGCRTLHAQLIFNNGSTQVCTNYLPYATIGKRLSCRANYTRDAWSGICYVYLNGVTAQGWRDVNFNFRTKVWF
jgi:hypothetical protein